MKVERFLGGSSVCINDERDEYTCVLIEADEIDDLIGLLRHYQAEISAEAPASAREYVDERDLGQLGEELADKVSKPEPGECAGDYPEGWLKANAGEPRLTKPGVTVLEEAGMTGLKPRDPVPEGVMYVD